MFHNGNITSSRGSRNSCLQDSRCRWIAQKMLSSGGSTVIAPMIARAQKPRAKATRHDNISPRWSRQPRRRLPTHTIANAWLCRSAPALTTEAKINKIKHSWPILHSEKKANDSSIAGDSTRSSFTLAVAIFTKLSDYNKLISFLFLLAIPSDWHFAKFRY